MYTVAAVIRGCPETSTRVGFRGRFTSDRDDVKAENDIILLLRLGTYCMKVSRCVSTTISFITKLFFFYHILNI